MRPTLGIGSSRPSTTASSTPYQSCGIGPPPNCRVNPLRVASVILSVSPVYQPAGAVDPRHELRLGHEPVDQTGRSDAFEHHRRAAQLVFGSHLAEHVEDRPLGRIDQYMRAEAAAGELAAFRVVIRDNHRRYAASGQRRRRRQTDGPRTDDNWYLAWLNCCNADVILANGKVSTTAMASLDMVPSTTRAVASGTTSSSPKLP